MGCQKGKSLAGSELGAGLLSPVALKVALEVAFVPAGTYVAPAQGLARQLTKPTFGLLRFTFPCILTVWLIVKEYGPRLS